MQIALRINGAEHPVDVPPSATLLSVLRDDLGLTGTRYGCGIGRCGACSVIADSRAVASCLLTAEQAGRMEITTIEGLASGATLHPAQEAFVAGAPVEFGQGIRTGFAQIVADELDVPLDRVTVVMGDTDRVPHDFGTFGSHSTQQEAPVFRRAAAFGRAQLLERAARRLEVSADRLDT